MTIAQIISERRQACSMHLHTHCAGGQAAASCACSGKQLHLQKAQDAPALAVDVAHVLKHSPPQLQDALPLLLTQLHGHLRTGRVQRRTLNHIPQTTSPWLGQYISAQQEPGSLACAHFPPGGMRYMHACMQLLDCLLEMHAVPSPHSAGRYRPARACSGGASSARRSGARRAGAPAAPGGTTPSSACIGICHTRS